MAIEDETPNITPSPEEAQESLDCALHDLQELSLDLVKNAEYVDALVDKRNTLHAIQQELGGMLENEHVSSERLLELQTSAESVWLELDPGRTFPDYPDTESVDGLKTHVALSLETLSVSVASFERWVSTMINKTVLSAEQFFAGTQRVSSHAIDVLAHADRLLDTNTQSSVTTLTLTGASAKALQAGKQKLSFNKAVEETVKVGEYTAHTWLPAQLKYAHGIADAFNQSDLTHITDAAGLTLHGFMKRAGAFAAVRPFVPEFCKHDGEHRYFFKLFHDTYRTISSSDPLPGNRIIEVTHPVGDLQKYLEREDVKGFQEHFIPWLTVSVSVVRTDVEPAKELTVAVPSHSELRQDIENVRKLAKDLRDLTVKSSEVKAAMEAMLGAYETHINKHWEGTINKIKNLSIGLVPGIYQMNHIYGRVATGATSSLYGLVLDVGNYLSSQCHGLASVSLKCAKTFRSNDHAS